MTYDVTNHLLPWVQVKRMLKQAWDEGYIGGFDDACGDELYDDEWDDGPTHNPYDKEDT